MPREPGAEVDAGGGPGERSPNESLLDSSPEGEGLPLADWPPPEILERWAVRRKLQRRRRIRRRRTYGLAVLVALVAIGSTAIVRSSGGGRTGPVAAPTPTEGSVALAVSLSLRPVVAVVAVAGNHQSVVVAVPAATEVDVTGGSPITVADAAATPGLMVASVQAALDRRVDHYVATGSTALASLVDALGGVTVQSEAAFTYGSEVLGPGPVRLTGGPAVAYLEQSLDEDATGRWEEVLAGIFSAKGGQDVWRSLVGESDAIDQARALLAQGQADQAIVLELPTAPAPDGGVIVDADAAADLVNRHFGPPSGELVRVIVLNGNGRPTVGSEIAALLAPAGFRVVAAQDAVSFNVSQSEVVAGGDRFVPDAERVQALLGVGMVYVDSQPTGIADITIKVGKDFQPG